MSPSAMMTNGVLSWYEAEGKEEGGGEGRGEEKVRKSIRKSNYSSR